MKNEKNNLINNFEESSSKDRDNSGSQTLFNFSQESSMDFDSGEDSAMDLVSEDSSMDFDLPPNQSSVIKVIGVGGGGSNAVNHMIKQGIKGVDFIICNTDAQALDQGQALTKIQLGMSLTEGLGAGENPFIGAESAIESEKEIKEILQKNAKMVFVTAGMGGGTGTGAAPIIARISKELNILTIGIVTAPFSFEGPKRFKQAQDGIKKMRKYVDSLIVINNDKLVEVYGDLEVTSGFAKADEILMVAARSIAEVITQNCTLNIDLNDAKTVLQESGTAIMGSGRASGPNRAEEVVRSALDSPLLNDNHINGAKQILLLILSGDKGITIKEINEINSNLQRQAGGSANIILGIGNDLTLKEDISVTIIATGVISHDVDPTTGFEAKKVHVLNSEEEISVEADLPTSDSTIEETKNQKINNVEIQDNTVEFNKNADTNINQNSTVSNKVKKPILKENIIYDNIQDFSLEEQKRAAERKKRLQKYHNLNFKNEVVLKELEKQPAYKRKGMELDEVEHSSSEPVSRISLNLDQSNVELKNNNSFLHDNVD